MKRLRWLLDSPLQIGLVLAAVLVAGLLVWETAFDRWPGIVQSARTGLVRQPTGPLRDFRIAIVHCLLVGYLPAAFLAVVRGGRKTVHELQGALDCTTEECDALADSMRMNTGGLAADLKSIDLFDLEPLLPFTQQGLVNALLLMGFVTIAGLMVLTETGFGLLGLLVGTAVLGGAGIAAALPMRGVHRRITQAKAAELDWVEAKLREQRTVLKAGADRTSGDLSDLAAYRDLVRSVRDWPINTSSYVRFALYLLIPVTSWAAAAVVERLVDAML